MALQPSQSAHLPTPPNQISCIVCRQRKVKCDKQQRCSNCVRSGIECTYAIPARPRRRIGNGKSPEDVSREELIHRVRRYEMLFRKHGLRFDDPVHEGDGGKNSRPEPHTATNVAVVHDHALQHTQSEDGKPRLTPQSNLWTEDLSGDILEDLFDRDSPSTSALETPNESWDPLTLRFTFDSVPESLSHFHPSSIQIFRLWEKFLDNVNPLVKIIHVPTVQRQLLEASVDLENVSRSFEALMFAIYASAITSLSNEECMELMNVPRQQLLKLYYKIAQQALTRAGIFATTDIIVLQAAVILFALISVIPQYDPGEVYVLLGMVLRIGERMGIHRDTYPANLSVIEVQTRRRLWWQIIVLDSRCAQRSRVDVYASSEHWESALPLNVNDSDLTPDMAVEPRGHVGSTEMTFRLMLYDIGKFIRHSAEMAPFGGSWQKLSGLSTLRSEKDKVIDSLEEMLESRYLRHCDPVIPLHILTRSIATIVVSRMRLMLRHPGQFLNRRSSMSKEEKGELFNICLTMIEQDNLLHDVDCVRGFLWLVGQEFQVDAFVYLLSELRCRDPVPQTERAWSEIAKTFKHHPNMASYTRIPLNVAISKLALTSWESWESRARYERNLEPSRPEFILKLLKQRTTYYPGASTEYSGDSVSMDLDPNAPASYATSGRANWGFGSSSLSDPLAPIDWNYWNGLIEDAETYTINNPASGMGEWSA